MKIEMLPENVRIWVRDLFSLPSSTDPELRLAVEARSAALGGAERPALELPAALAPFVEKVAGRPFEVTDQDVADLLASGYSEEEVLELTLCAAAGAGLARLEAGLSVLKEAGRTGEEGGCA